MLDIHTHLFWKSYDVDRDAVVARAKQAGVTKMICVGTEPEDNPLALGITERYEGVFAAVGIHPHFFNERVEKELPVSHSQLLDKAQFLNFKIQNCIAELRALAKHPKVVAIGECGLDYYSHGPKKIITAEQKKLQKAGFLAQLELAQELGLPVIVHCRDAYEDVLDLLKARSQKLKAIILHCYQGDTEVTKQFLELENIYFSFAGNITYPVKKAVAGTKDDPGETVKLVPLGRLFTETDCPFLAPQDKRGERNEPAFVAYIVDKIAALKAVEREEVAQATETCAKGIFAI